MTTFFALWAVAATAALFVNYALHEFDDDDEVFQTIEWDDDDNTEQDENRLGYIDEDGLSYYSIETVHDFDNKD